MGGLVGSDLQEEQKENASLGPWKRWMQQRLLANAVKYEFAWLSGSHGAEVAPFPVVQRTANAATRSHKCGLAARGTPAGACGQRSAPHDV